MDGDTPSKYDQPNQSNYQPQQQPLNQLNNYPTNFSRFGGNQLNQNNQQFNPSMSQPMSQQPLNQQQNPMVNQSGFSQPQNPMANRGGFCPNNQFDNNQNELKESAFSDADIRQLKSCRNQGLLIFSMNFLVFYLIF